MCLGSQTRFKASASAKCSGALVPLYIRNMQGPVAVLGSRTLHAPAVPLGCVQCVQVCTVPRGSAGSPLPPPDSSSLRVEDEHHRPRIVQRLFSARLPVQVFLFIGVRSRPGGPEAVHGAAPGAGRGRGHHSNQQSRGEPSRRSKPQHRARYSAY